MHGGGMGSKAFFRHAVVSWPRVCDTIEEPGTFELCASRVGSRTWRHIRLGQQKAAEEMALVAVCRGIPPSHLPPVMVHTPFTSFTLERMVRHVVAVVGPRIAHDNRVDEMFSLSPTEGFGARTAALHVGECDLRAHCFPSFRSLHHLSIQGCAVPVDFSHLRHLVTLSTDAMDLRTLCSDALESLYVTVPAAQRGDVLFSGQHFPRLHSLFVACSHRTVTVRDLHIPHPLSSLTLWKCAIHPPLPEAMHVGSFCKMNGIGMSTSIDAPAICVDRPDTFQRISCSMLRVVSKLNAWAEGTDLTRLASLDISTATYKPSFLHVVVRACGALEKLVVSVQFTSKDLNLDLSSSTILHLCIIAFTVSGCTLSLPPAARTMLAQLRGTSKMTVKESGAGLDKVSFYSNAEKGSVAVCVKTMETLRTPSCCMFKVRRNPFNRNTLDLYDLFDDDLLRRATVCNHPMLRELEAL